eukprot:TRINITY_DN76168_c0_g1_i1.p1 TRINITY_DN76168_c0_g1~~TRINITY_DN76168_c0_g1_i1.p1  ORF type:complete len:502 (-),score=77.94 TRINITY_DN76168_c0_g1_i1:75-1385(-)
MGDSRPVSVDPSRTQAGSMLPRSASDRQIRCATGLTPAPVRSTTPIVQPPSATNEVSTYPDPNAIATTRQLSSRALKKELELAVAKPLDDSDDEAELLQSTVKAPAGKLASAGLPNAGDVNAALRSRVSALEAELQEAQATIQKLQNAAAAAAAAATAASPSPQRPLMSSMSPMQAEDVTGVSGPGEDTDAIGVSWPAEVRDAVTEGRRVRIDIDKLWRAVLLEAGPSRLRILQDRDRAARALAEARLDWKRRSDMWDEVREEVDDKIYLAIARTFEAIGGGSSSGEEGHGLPVQVKKALFEMSTPTSASRRQSSARGSQARRSTLGATLSGSASTPLSSRSLTSARHSFDRTPGFERSPSTQSNRSARGNSFTFGSTFTGPTATDSDAAACQRAAPRSASTPVAGPAPPSPPVPQGRSGSAVRERINAMEQQQKR